MNISLNSSANLNPFNRTFNWRSLDSIGICDGFGSLCPFNGSNTNLSYYAYTILLAPWITTVYLTRVGYVEIMNINYNIIDFINDDFYYYLGVTIPYSYWWFSAITLVIGLIYTYFGLTVAAFCAG